MTIVNHDATQFVAMILLDRYVPIAYGFVDFTALLVAGEASWVDWSEFYEAAQTAFYVGSGITVLQATEINPFAGRFTPRQYLAFRWSGIPAGAFWSGTVTMTFRARITDAIHAVPQQVTLYAIDNPALPVFAQDNTDDASITDPQLYPAHRKIQIARNIYDSGLVIDAGAGQDLTFTFDASLVSHIIRGAAWNGSFGVLMETRRFPQDTPGAAPPELTAVLPIVGPGLGIPPLARITVDQVIFTESGRSTPNVGARSRFDRCPRCGRMSLRETWVRDGLTGILVDRDCYDPPDPPPRPYPPERRGINEDG